MSDYTLEDLVQEREWRKIAPDWDASSIDELLEAFLYFTSRYWWIRHPERGRIKFVLFDAQIDCVRMWLNERYSVSLKARQIGFSTLISTFTFWSTFFYSDRAIVMLSKTERDAVKLLEKAKYGSRFLPDWIKNRGPVMQINQTRMGFSNESYLESLPSASDPARGESVYTVVVDELGLLPNSEEAWAAIEPIADVGGRVIMLGTAHGEGNLFHKLWVGSQNKTNRFKGMFFPWWSGDRDEDWYESKRRDLPDWQLAQEYPSDPDEAFLRSGHPVFNVDAIKSMAAVDPSRGHLIIDEQKPAFDAVANGPLRIWELPETSMRYCIGADVAEGLEHGDYSVAYVIEAKSRRVVACYHARVDADLFGSDVLFNLGRFYNQALIGVESNNHGLSTNKALQRVLYNPLYRQRPVNRIAHPQPTDVLGWRTTSITKPVAIDELNKALRDGELYLYDAECHAELRTFVREGDGKMHGSPHDDRVMALSIAVQMLKYVWLREYQPVTEPPPGTFGWFEKMMFGKLEKQRNAKDERPPIGTNYVRSTR
ncbi:MAG TPA: terminase family protein [Nitrospiraceae bacterium]|nr:terminase family protein [Nitrospiraceae bacterium]